MKGRSHWMLFVDVGLKDIIKHSGVDLC